MSSTDRQNRLLLAEDWSKIYQSFRNAEFQSYDAKFVFETKFGDFPLKRYFVVKEQEINTRVKMQIFWLQYSLDSNFKILSLTLNK